MIFNKLTTIIIFIISFNTINARDTNNVYLGLLFGYGQSKHFNVPYQGELTKDFYCIPQLLNGKVSEDYYLGLRLEYIFLNDSLAEKAVLLTGTYRNSAFNHSVMMDTYPAIVNDPQVPCGLSILNSKTRLDVKTTLNLINFDLLYKLKFKYILSFGFSVGPFINFPIKTNSYEEYKIISPDSAKFDKVPGYIYKDNNRTVLLYDNEINDFNFFYWGMKANIFIEHELCDLIKTSLEAGYAHPLSNFAKDSEWKIESSYANLIMSIKLNELFGKKR